MLSIYIHKSICQPMQKPPDCRIMLNRSLTIINEGNVMTRQSTSEMRNLFIANPIDLLMLKI